jgi:hypothetical protein
MLTPAQQAENPGSKDKLELMMHKVRRRVGFGMTDFFFFMIKIHGDVITSDFSG